MAKEKKKINLSTLFLFIGGLLLLIKFIIDGGIPSPSSNIFEFLIGLFIALVIIAFYFIFLFGVKNYSLTIRAFAPSVLILILFGGYGINFIETTVTGIFAIIAKLSFLLMILTGFVFLFIKNKIIGYVFFISSIVYGTLIFASSITVAIYDAVNSSAFAYMNFIIAMVLVAAVVLLGLGIYFIVRNKKVLDI